MADRTAGLRKARLKARQQAAYGFVNRPEVIAALEAAGLPVPDEARTPTEDDRTPTVGVPPRTPTPRTPTVSAGTAELSTVPPRTPTVIGRPRRRTPVVSSEATNGRGEESAVVPLSVVPSKQNSNQPTLFAGAAPRRIRDDGWVEIAVGIWGAYFGSVQHGRMGKALKGAVEAGGAEAVLRALRNWCEDRKHDPPEFLIPEKFAATWRKYADRTDPQQAARAAQAVAVQLDTEEREKRERGRALREAARRGDLDAE